MPNRELPANLRVPRDDNWTYEVYNDCDFAEMVAFANKFDSSNDDDWRIELYGLIEQIAIRALENRDLLEECIKVIGRHIRFIPRKWAALATPGLLRLLETNDESIRQKLVDNANGWDVERQKEFFRRFSPDTRGEGDPVLAEQINLLDVQEKYGFKPKFGITASNMFPDDPIPIVKYYNLNEDR